MQETTEIQKTEQLPAEKSAEKPKKKKLSKKKIALIVAAALILVPLGSCVYGTLTYKPALNGAAASMGEIRTTVSFSANVAGDGLEKYPVPETTEVEKVYFETGDSVKAGDLIVKFDNSEAVDAYKKATISYETARLQLNETEKDYWDLKEDLDECIEDIEFYKKKWKGYHAAHFIAPGMGYQDISRGLPVHFQQEPFGIGVFADAGFKGAAEVIRVHSMQYSTARIEILAKREEHCLILRF